ncbi:MAG: hypothetical protein QF738_06870 [Rhodospirillales bacterium]|nr:hypothetical protein [Rhodospirillales bacterium]
MVLDQIARVIAVQGLEVGAHLGPFARNVSEKPLAKDLDDVPAGGAASVDHLGQGSRLRRRQPLFTVRR